MAMANMNLIGIFVTKLWPVQALACGGDGGGATKNIIPPKFENFVGIMFLVVPRYNYMYPVWPVVQKCKIPGRTSSWSFGGAIYI